MFQTKLANKNFYIANISKMSLRLAKLQKVKKEIEKIKVKNLDRYKNIDEILLYKKQLFIFEKI